MANANNVYGLRYVGSASGNATAKTIRCALLAADGTATFAGDAVKMSGSADANGVPSINQYVVGDPVFGVILAFEPNEADLTVKHRVASTLRYAMVCIDQQAIYEIQEDAVGGAAAAVDVGLNAELIVGSGSTTSGLSGMQLDTSTKATTATLAVRIIGFVRRPDNEIGANAKMLVMLNERALGDATVGV